MTAATNDERTEPEQRAEHDVLPPRVGRFIILSRLGAGGMGVVYSAYDPDLDRKVAIKVLLRAAVDAESRARMQREARAMARLSDPHVVGVHDVGEHDGQVFIAMELVNGQTLRAWLSEVRGWRDVIPVYMQAGRGLAAAHAADIVHRDFKPENVLLDDRGRVRVTDFGLSQAAPQDLAGDSGSQTAFSGTRSSVVAEALTEHGAVIGTPAYMSPEQIMGRPADANSDQFSFCVALWEALYGERPFAGDSLVDLALAVTHGEVRVSAAATKLPDWLRPILVRGLRVVPSERWPTMLALLGALERGTARGRRRVRALAGVAAITVCVGGFGGWRIELERRRGACERDAATIDEAWNEDIEVDVRDALVGTGVVYAQRTVELALPYFDQYVSDWREKYVALCVMTDVDGARTSESWAASLTCLNDRLGEMSALINVLMDAPDATVVQRTVNAASGLGRLEPCADESWLRRSAAQSGTGEDESIAEIRRGLWRAEALDAAGQYQEGLVLARQLAEATADHPNVRLAAEVRRAAGELAEKAGAPEEARELLTDAFDLAIGGGHDEIARRVAGSLAYTVGYQLAQHAEGSVWGRVARGLETRLGDDDDIARARLRRSLGSVFSAQGRWAEAEAAFAEALAFTSHAVGPDHPSTALAHNNLGGVFSQQGRDAEAEKSFASSIAISETTLGADHPEVARAYGNLGVVYQRQGRHADAERAVERALAIAMGSLGSAHPSVASYQKNLGILYLDQGRNAAAEHSLDEALASSVRSFGPNHPEVAMGQVSLGDLYMMQHRYADAEVVLTAACAILEKAESPRLKTSQSILGNLYMAQGRHAEAERLFAEARRAFEKELGPDHPMVAVSHSDIGGAYHAQGRYAEAEDSYKKALTISEKSLGPEHAQVANVLVGLAFARLSQARSTEAIVDAERALAIRAKVGGTEAEFAELKFLLAQALWTAKREPTRWPRLATEARDAYRAAGAAHTGALANVERWIVAPE